MIASLPMYWTDQTAAPWRKFWSHVQTAYCAALPDTILPAALPDLTAPEDLPPDWTRHWLSPDLILSMTCGLPLRTALRHRVTYVGTLGFGLDGPGGHYHSVIIRRRGSASADVLAYNSDDSQSGWAAAQGLPFRSTVQTGSHAASFRAVAEGRADIACIDAVTWRLLQRMDPDVAKVEVTGHTEPAPGLPLITALGRDPAPLRAALRAAIASWRPADPMAIGGPLSLHILPEDAYLSMPVPPPPPRSPAPSRAPS